MKLTKRTFIKNLLILVLWFSTASCASSVPNGIHSEFSDYVSDFSKLLPQHAEKANNLNMHFSDFRNSKKESDRNVLGRCTYSLLYGNTIEIDTTYWYSSTPTSKYFTILHEMGHCVCYIHHSQPTQGLLGKLEDFLFKLGVWKKKGFLDDGCPASIMFPSEFAESCYLKHFYHYINEFKQSCNERIFNGK
jgi:hypothetical protein